MTAHWTDALVQLDACEDAIIWALGYDSLAAAWAACVRGDWMLWLAGRMSGEPDSTDRKRLVACACACARLSLPHTSDPRVLACIETTERWTRAEASIDDVRAATTTRASASAAAWVAAAEAAEATAGTATLRECSDIVRRHYPSAPAALAKAGL